VEVRGVTSNGKGSSSLPIFVLLRADNVQNDGSDVGPRTIKRKINTPVLYTTGQGLTDGMQAMFVERFGFLAKPYTPEQLVIAVEKLLSKN
jgi:DNA-binding NtrC family response regulator